MKTYKSIDFFIQVGLLLAIVVTYFVSDPEKLSPFVFVTGFAVVQIISILVHLASGPRPWKMPALRKYHLIGTALILAGIVVSIMQGEAARTGDKDDKYNMAGLGTLVYLTIPAILLALFYTIITAMEWRRMKKIDS